MIRLILTGLFLLFLSIGIADGGKFIFSVCKINHINAQEGHSDSESPHINYSLLPDDDRIADVTDNKVELSFPDALKAEFEFGVKTRDFSGLVWQPPKSC